MKLLAFDTETHLITPGNLAPRLVCMSTYDGEEGDLFTRDEAIERFAEMITDDSLTLIGHNVAYDMAVMAAAEDALLSAIFEAYADGRVKDTKIREQLSFIAQGRLQFDFVEKVKHPSFSLAACVRRNLNEHLEKEDTWRLRYAELDGVPLEDWPADAAVYALDDAQKTFEVYVQQERLWNQGKPMALGITNEDEQVRAAWALHLMSCWGLRTDPEKVPEFLRQLRREDAALKQRLLHGGLMSYKRKRVDGVMTDVLSKSTKEFRRRVEEGFLAQGKPPPRTEPSTRYPEGQIKADKEACLESGDSLLMAYADESGAEKILSVWGDYLQQGMTETINHGYNVLVDSGRTSAFKPNTQNLHRKTGLRECFIPREGNVFIAADYSTIELCALAQVCLDLGFESEMAKAINAGADLHQEFADSLDGLTRQEAKAANFGFPGGMGADAFAAYAKGQGVSVSPGRARELKAAWLERFPEMREYFRYIGDMSPMGNDFSITQLRSSRVRGKVHFTSGCNTLFQGLAADGAKEALFDVAWQCYVTEGSALQGCRPMMFVHDEIIVEAPRDRATHAAQGLSEVMRWAMEKWIPDVRITVEAACMERWYKGAEPVWVDGELMPWRPE